MASAYLICIGGVIFMSETIRRDCHRLTPSVTLGDIVLLYLLSVTLSCDIYVVQLSRC